MKAAVFFEANKNLKKMRGKLHLTQNEFAVSLGIARSMIGAWEEGRTPVAIYLIDALVRKGYLSKRNVYDFLFSKKF